MNEQNITKAHLLGHSMGGKIALWIALNYPEYINKLIPADIAPISYNHCFNNLIDTLKALPLKEITNRKQADDWLATYWTQSDYRQFLLQNLLLRDGEYQWRINLDYFKHNAKYIVGFPDTTGLSPYFGKTAFIVGADSPYVKRDDLFPFFPTAQFIAIPNAAHWLHIQQPELFIAQVEQFLSHS